MGIVKIDPPVVCVFGGSRLGPGTQEYEIGIKLGSHLATKGYTVLTGGYFGLMEATSRGVHETGGHVTAIAHAPWGAPNKYVQDFRTAPTLFSRLQGMIEDADAFVALRGGMGTVTEVALVWVLLQAQLLSCCTPLILIGKEWARVLEVWQSQLTLSEMDCSLIDLVQSPEEAVEVLSVRLGK